MMASYAMVMRYHTIMVFFCLEAEPAAESPEDAAATGIPAAEVTASADEKAVIDTRRRHPSYHRNPIVQ